MRQSFAHDAVLTMDAAADTAAPGAAVTVALCGHWEHEPPCPLAPHHTSAQRDGDAVHLRILFATEPEQERAIRTRIDEVLAARWQVRSSRPGIVRPSEADHAAGLARS